MAVYAHKSTMGPEDLVPMLQVFGALPRPAKNTPAPRHLRQQQAIEEAKNSTATKQAKRKIDLDSRHPSVTKGKEASRDLRNLPYGADVLVYRTEPKIWEEAFKFFSIDGETAVIQLPRDRRTLRSMCVKQFVNQQESDRRTKAHNPCYGFKKKDNDAVMDEAHSETKHDGIEKEEDLGTVLKKITAKPGTKEEQMFAETHKAELEGLLRNGTFKPVKIADLPPGHRIFGARFDDEIKKAEAGLSKKSRLVSQKYSDEDESTIPTKAPTVQKVSQRTTFSAADLNDYLDAVLKDIVKAYIQAMSKLTRRVFLKAPMELDMPEGYVL